MPILTAFHKNSPFLFFLGLSCVVNLLNIPMNKVQGSGSKHL